MGKEFLNNLNIHGAGQIQFKTTAGANAGKIDQDGNNLVLTNAVGDILLGDGSSDVYIGDGTNNVDIIFEQSGSIKGDGSAVTLTLGGANTTLNLENPNFTGNITMSSKLKFTTTNGYILFDYEPSGDTGEYSTEVPLLKVDQNGTESTILARVSEYRAVALGIDDTVWLRGGDTSSVVRSNVNLAEEIVLMSAESGFRAIGFPNNDTTWSNRQEFKFYTAGTDITLNGLYIGDAGSTQFIDLSRNLKNIGTIDSGAIEATGVVDGAFTGLRIMNQKTYGSGTGINETARLVLGIAESGQAHSNREGFVIETYTADQSDSSNINTEFKVRDGGTIGTAMKLTGSNKNVDFYSHVNLQDGKGLMWGGNDILKHNGTQTYIGDNTSGSVVTITGGDADFTGNVEMQSGNSVGKFAVMSSAPHGSFDFYNNGTSYFNGDVTIDANITQTTGTAATFSGSLTVNGNSSSFDTGNNGTFVTNDTNNYPRITVQSASAQLGLFRSNNNVGGMYIGGASDGFRIWTEGFSSKFHLDQSGNGTFAGNLTLPASATLNFSTDIDLVHSTDTLLFKQGGSDRFKVSGDVGVIGATDFYIPAGRKLLLDGLGGHTYIEEESDSNLKFYVAGGERLNVTTTEATFTGDITLNPTSTSNNAAPHKLIFKGTDYQGNTDTYGQIGFEDDGNLTQDGSNFYIKGVDDNGNLYNIMTSDGYGQISFGGNVTSGATLSATNFSGNIAKSGDFTVDVAGDIILDADGGDIFLKDGGTEFGLLANTSSSLVVMSRVQDKDIIFKGNDGGSTVTALTLDMSSAGEAKFNSNIRVPGEINLAGSTTYSIDLKDHSNYTWLRNEPGQWSFQSGTSGDDWTQSWQIYVPNVNSDGGNATFVELGQRHTNDTTGEFKGIKIVKRTGAGVVDGDFQAGTTTLSSLTVSGDLTVNGITTTTNVVNLDLEDNIIGLNRGSTSNANDSGLIIERGSTGDNAAFLWDESIGYFSFGTTTANPAATGSIVNESAWSWKPIKASGAVITGSVTATSLDINGNADISGDLTGVDHITASGTVTANQINLDSIGDYITFYGGGETNHSITSRQLDGGTGDDIRVNTYGSFIINLDSNNNQSTASNSSFFVGRHGGNASAIGASDLLFQIDGQTGHALPGVDATQNLGNSSFRWGALELKSGGQIQWQNGDARIIEGLVNNYSLSLQTYDGSALSTALRLDGDNTATFAGDIAVGPKSNATVQVSESGNATVKMLAGSVGRVGTYSSHNLNLMANSNTVLTLDTSQNATFAGDITLGANHIGRDGDNYIGFATDNLIKFRVNGATQVKLSDGVFAPQTDSDVDLGSNGTRFANVYADTLYGDGSNITNISAPSNMVTTDTSQTISGNKNFTGTGNQFNGHIYFNAYDSQGNHYPHFRDGSASNGANINIRHYYGSANYKTHVMSSDSSGNMQFDFQGTLKGDALTIDGAVDINGNTDISGTLTSGKHVINTASDDILTLNQTSTDNKWNYINFNNQGTREWFIGQDSSGNFDLYNDNIDAYAITVGYTNNAIGLNGNVSVTGNIAVTGTVDGVDIASRDAVLTTTTTTANAALPKAGGTMTGTTSHGDNVKSKWGADDDIQIYSDNTTAYIEMPTLTNFIIGDSTAFNTGNIALVRAGVLTGTKSIEEDWMGVYTSANTGLSYMTSSGTVRIETQNSGAKVTGKLQVTGDIENRSIPMVIHGSFDDTTSSTSNLIIPLAGSITENTVSNASAPHFFTIPYACVLKKVIMKTVSGSMSSSFTTELKAYKNGAVTGNSSSGEITHVSSSASWTPTAHSDITYAAGDKFALVYQKSATSKYWQDVAVTIVFTLTDYDI